MRVPVPLRRRPVLVLLLPAVPLLILVSQASRTSDPLPGSWTWTVAHSVLLLIVPAAVASTGAALEASRLRTRRAENVVNTRSPTIVLLSAIWPSYAAGLLLQTGAIGLVAATAWGGSSAVPAGLLGAIAALLAFHLAAGFLLGSLLRPVHAAPLALAFSYCWLGFTGAVDWFAPRHLAGLVLESCCFYDEQPHGLSIAAAAAFSLFATSAFLSASAGLLGLLGEPRAALVGLPSLLLVLAVSLGLLLARPLGSTATQPRDTAGLDCSGTRIAVCLYPEQLASGDPRQRIEAMVLRLPAALGLPARVLASRGPATAEGLTLRYVPGMTDLQIAAALASGVQGDQLLQCSEPTARTIAREQVGDALRGWLTQRMAPSAGGESGMEPTAAALLAAVLRLPDDGQLRWASAASASLRDCAIVPPDRLS